MHTQCPLRVISAPSGELPSSTPIWVRLTLRLLSLAIVVALGAIGTWVAFGPGERDGRQAAEYEPLGY
jgi:hypothetical protein